MALNTPTTINNITIPYRIKWGDLSEGTEGYVGNAQISYRVAYAQRWEFVRQINGIFGGSVQLPMQYPDVPNFLVKSTSMRNFGYDNCASPYKFTEVTATFATPTYSLDGDNVLLTIDYDSGASIVTCPAGIFKFVNSGYPVKESVGVEIPIQSLLVTKHRVQTFNFSTYNSLIGSINSTLFLGCDPKTVLCMPLKSQSQTNFGGVTLTDYTLGFAFRAVPYDQILNESGSFEAITPAPYPIKDLNILLN